MDTPLEVYALLPPEQHLPEVTDAHLEEYDAALTALTEGRWVAAAAMLTHLPDEDGPAQFLRGFLAESGLNPPLNWDGVISLDQK